MATSSESWAWSSHFRYPNFETTRRRSFIHPVKNQIKMVFEFFVVLSPDSSTTRAPYCTREDPGGNPGLETSRRVADHSSLKQMLVCAIFVC